MSALIYALVVRDPDIVLAEYSRAQGNFPQITRQLLPNLPRSGKNSFNYNESYAFHYIAQQNMIFMCLAESAFPKRICFSFLSEVQGLFLQKYSEVVNTVIAFGVNAEFSEVLKSKMQWFSTDPGADKLQSVQKTVDTAKDIMVENIDKVISRGTKVELLVKKFEIMSDEAVTMRRGARRVRKAMWWRGLRVYLVCGGLFALLALLVAFSFCSIDFSEC